MTRLTFDDLESLSLGAAVLGTGGGGDPYIGRLALRYQMELRGEPSYIPAADLADDAMVVTIGMAGSPAVALEKLITLSFADAPLRKIEKWFGRKADAVIPIEIGGMNSLLPLLTACATGLPVVDADGMGRAYPGGDKTTFWLAGISPYPMIMMNEHGETVILEGVEGRPSEHIARAAMVELGGAVSAATYVMTGRQAKDSAIHGTITLAIELGRAIREARREKLDPFEAILGRLAATTPPTYGRMLFDGKVVDLTRNQEGGFNIGRGLLEATDGSDDTMSFAFQNEYLYARSGNEILALVPDLVCFLDRDTAEPITCESVRYGQRIKVIGIAGAPQFRSPAGLEVAGPGAFGLKETYVPIETLANRR